MKTKRRNKKNGNDWRRTFHEIADETRLDSAQLAWERAKLASGLRHYAHNRSHRRASRLLGRIKAAAIRNALEVAPTRFASRSTTITTSDF